MTTSARVDDIVFTRHPAARGVAWLREAWSMFNANRIAWLVLMSIYCVLMALLQVVPYVGQVAVPLLRPVFAVGLLAAAWTQERGGYPSARLLFTGFRSNLRALIPLGMMFIAGIVIAILSTALVDGGLLLALMSQRQEVTPEVSNDPRLQLGLVVATLVALPTVLALWFAPALVVFQDAGPGIALGASLRAATANWRPIALYGVTLFTVGAVIPIVLAQVVVMALGEAVIEIVQFVLIAWAMLVVAATVHISDYVSYRDVFHFGETLAPLAAARGDRQR
jgi:hypothetical protein